MFLESAPLGAAFDTSNKLSLVNIRLLRHGLDIDLQSGKGSSSLIDFYLRKRIEQFRSLNNY
jgi:hypothetical protein